MYTIQAEIAQELISNDDATIIGILLAFIVLLITVIGLLWRQKVKDEDYIREQDKANIEMLNLITNAVTELGKSSDSNTLKLDSVNTRTSTILEIVKK